MGTTRKITSIELQAKRKDRFSVFLDDEFAFGIHQDVLLQSGIARGDELTEEQIEEILFLETRRAAKEKAMRLLAARPRSIHEIKDRLSQAKYPPPIIDWVVSELQRVGLLDDSEFARMFARSRMVTRPCGQFLLRRELKEKGLPPEAIETAVEEAYKEKSERTLALELARKRKKRYQNLEPDKAKKRVSDFLLRRGFHWDMINEILEDWESL